uniref:DNA helicase n=1 Tax=Denticeps clupeoides TaxID=299321 RepID=A0AAY4A9T4_9TELE
MDSGRKSGEEDRKVSPEGAEAPQTRKKRRDSETDDSEQEGPEPSWKEQEDMVRKLQRRFPQLDKEELRDVLQEHDWLFEDTLEALCMFSEEGKCPVWVLHFLHHRTKLKRRDYEINTRELKKTAQGKVKRRRIVTHDSDSGGEDVTSDFEATSTCSDLEIASAEGGTLSKLKIQILTFFQEASLDELSLIAGCSLRKAQKIVELRPFKKWEDLALHQGNGLTVELLSGCKEVLREREVVQGLMGRCEGIAKKMSHDVSSLLEGGPGSMAQPRVLSTEWLKPYQLVGLKWLSLLHWNNLSGILADEMGLGKTIQAISFLASLYQEGNRGPHLIIVPSSTLGKWLRTRRCFLWLASLDGFPAPFLRPSILSAVLLQTEYNLAIGNTGDRSLFRKLKLEYAVFDEGHMLKNMNSLRYRHLMAINAKHRLLLTGTPLQNNLLELMSLLNFIMPSMFSSSTSQIAKMFSMVRLYKTKDQSSFEKERIAHAKLIMKPFILRRVKSEVLKQLPAKEERVDFCPMTDRQQELYDALFRKLKGSASGEKRELTNVMMHLRKMANHPLLHRMHYTMERLAAMSQLMTKETSHRDSDPTLVKEDMAVLSDFELHKLCLQYPVLGDFKLTSELLLDSGKLCLLTKLLKSLKEEGSRVVLFSQFTTMLDILEIFLKHFNHHYIRLDGSTPMADRIGLIDQFNTDKDIFVFLLSTKAGGLGINLTSANVVILHDIDCNPYNDKQAEDRCHRLGQTRTVQVIRLISKNTIEDDMLRIGQKKLKLEQDMTATTEGDDDVIPDDMASLLKASLGL